MKFNKKFFGFTVIIFAIEVIIALFIKDTIVRPYLGDILVVILFYTFIRTFVSKKIKGLPYYILGFAILVEISQLFDLVHVLHLENSKVATIVLGSTFDYVDIICYTIGALFLVLYESSYVRREAIERRKRQARRNKRRWAPHQRNEFIVNMIKNTIKVGSILGLIMALLIYGLNLYIIRSYDDRILTIEEIESMVLEEDYEAYDCIMVLGAGVWSDGDPSIMLSDRLDQGIVLYINEASDRLLMSGDHGRVNYDEVNVMKQYAIDRGIEADHIFMDHAGFSTYESMVRAKKVFGVKRMIVVTQGYHMYRALFIANELGIEADGFTADLQPYYKQRNRDIREVFARVKDYFYVVIEPEPTYLGDPIPITGLGSQTDDQ